MRTHWFHAIYALARPPHFATHFSSLLLQPIPFISSFAPYVSPTFDHLSWTGLFTGAIVSQHSN